MAPEEHKKETSAQRLKKIIGDKTGVERVKAIRQFRKESMAAGRREIRRERTDRRMKEAGEFVRRHRKKTLGETTRQLLEKRDKQRKAK